MIDVSVFVVDFGLESSRFVGDISISDRLVKIDVLRPIYRRFRRRGILPLIDPISFDPSISAANLIFRFSPTMGSFDFDFYPI